MRPSLRRTCCVGVVGIAVGALVDCSARRMPEGPPPEYEPPRVLPWDAAAPKDESESALSRVLGSTPNAGPDAGTADAARD